ncbi:hypothetical protein J6590_035213 [Homalodisca vitripennis]|nr:hypothetical protein J6590_035213 [Homalodisca vitripennis]
MATRATKCLSLPTPESRVIMADSRSKVTKSQPNLTPTDCALLIDGYKLTPLNRLRHEQVLNSERTGRLDKALLSRRLGVSTIRLDYWSTDRFSTLIRTTD